MNKTVTPFTVLIERRVVQALGRLLLTTTALVLATFPAQAQSSEGKVAADLMAIVALQKTPRLDWVRDVGGRRHVKALVISNSRDSDLSDLRAAVLQMGGSVYMRFVSVSSLSVMLPADRLIQLAARADVKSISPNRPTARMASAVEATTGAMSPAVRSYASAMSYSGLDGSGVGIAVLDSGLMPTHRNFQDAAGKSRIVRALDFQKAGDAELMGVNAWKGGFDVSASLYPGSRTMTRYESAISNDHVDGVDAYGHASHVASIAAGRGFYQTPDTTELAPNAKLFDLKVLGADGTGQMSNVIAAIDWAIYNARRHNIRVMNLSLAADSTKSYLTDPMARAARSAVAAGITVVVAAGNFGLSAGGAEMFGSVSSPAHDPNVITVGSTNM